MTRSQQIALGECIFSIAHSVIVLIMCLITIFSCDQPGTFVTNDYCLVTPNIWHYRCLIFFFTYCLVDTLVLLFVIKNHKANKEAYFHHVLGILGSILSSYCGGWTTVGAAVNLVTEFSTPFVNIRSLLYDLNIRSGLVYTLNGVTMTLVFFLCRVVF